MQGHFITSWFRISLVNPLFCAPDCLLWRTLLWCAPDCCYGELYSGVRLTAAMVNPLFCAPDCRYGELYSGVHLTAAMANSTLVCAWLLLSWTLLWCVPDCCYGELYSGVRLTAAMMNPTLVCTLPAPLVNSTLTAVMVNSTLVCAWLPLLWTLLWCAPDCCYGELYSGVCLTAAMANSTLVCAWLLLWCALLWCAPCCCYGELYSGMQLTAASVNSLCCLHRGLGNFTAIHSEGKMQPCLTLSICHSLLNDILFFKFARIVCQSFLYN